MIVHVPLEKVKDNPWQTRKASEQESEYIVELAADIEAHSMMQMPRGRALWGKDVIELDHNPGVVDFNFDNEPELTVQLCFGHNRLAAYKRLFGIHGKVFEKFPVDIYPLSDEQMAVLAWSENEKRREHTAMERAHAIQERMTSFGWNHAEAAEKLGIGRSTVSNALRLFKLPEEAQKALDEGTISERVGMALVSLFDLPGGLRDYAENHFYMAQRPSQIVCEALKGNLSSDEVRRRIDHIVSEHGRKLGAADWSLDEELSIDNVTAPACRECEKRYKERNICLAPECFATKQNETHRSYLEKAGQACGIIPLEAEKYSYGMTTSFTGFRNKDHFEAIKASKCENLRLMYVSGKKEGEDQSQVKGFPNAFIVCGKREQFCNCLKGLEYASRSEIEGHFPEPMYTELERKEQEIYEEIAAPAEETQETQNIASVRGENLPGVSAEELQELAREARKAKKEANQKVDAIVEEAGMRIADGLAANNLKTWNTTAQKFNYNLHGNTLEELHFAIGQFMARTALPYEFRSVRELRTSMNRLLVECGLEELGDWLVDKAELPAAEEEPQEPQETQNIASVRGEEGEMPVF